MTCCSHKSAQCLGEVWGAKGNLDMEEKELDKEVPEGQKKPTLTMLVGQLPGSPQVSNIFNLITGRQELLCHL